jgi:carbonic anhydrase
VAQRDVDPTPEFLLSLTERNVIAQLENLRTHPTVEARLKEGDLALHGWVYHIGPGSVTAYNDETRRFEIPSSAHDRTAITDR